jgi:hypothetical protein
MDEELKQILKNILGDDAFNDGSMKVSDRVSKLVKSVNYLSTQLKIVKNDADQETKEYIDGIIDSVKNILK